MSYFRPLNASEGNIYNVRLNTPVIKTANLDINDVILTSLYTDPPIALLPANFSITINSTNKTVIINYGVTYVTNPTVNINVIGASYYDVLITSIDYTINTIICKIINPTSNNSIDPVTFQEQLAINISGPVISGQTFNINNRGFSTSGSDSSKLYTYMPVAIGTGQVNTQLNVYGSTSFSKFSVKNASTLTETDLRNSTFTLVDINATPGAPIKLSQGYQGQVITIYIKDASSTTMTIQGDTVNGSNFLYATNAGVNTFASLTFTAKGQSASIIYSVDDSTWYVYSALL